MKKHNTNAKFNRKKILNKLGMTYVELLCALSLLTLIVIMFTPMLLSSYETIYVAGERVENAYNSKEEIENKLSTRLEENIFTFNQFGLSDNADSALFQIEVTGKKIVSSLTHGLETVFGVARARISIISPTNVYDDQNNHNVILQVKGLDYKKVKFGKYNYSSDQAFINESKAAGGLIHIEVIIPQKAMTATGGISEEKAYTSAGLAKVKVKEKIQNGEIVYKTPQNDGEPLSNKRDSGRIYINISSATSTELDFTQSPVKIKVYYVDNRDKVKSTCDYLIIEPPTMLFAGGTSANVDYYTSAGVVEKGGTYKLEVNPRKMRLSNSGALVDGTDNPSVVSNFDGTTGTTINTVTWVDSDENPLLDPYYVMAGTYSRVYRMYNYRETAKLETVFPGAYSSTALSSLDTSDKSFVLSDGSVATQSFWSGDMSDQYYFKTLTHSSGYGAGEYVGVDGSQANSGNYNGQSRNHAGSRYDYFDKTLRYSMSFNGFTTGYDYQHLANRRISYVLTEVGGGRSFRFGGRLRDGEFSDYSMPWEPDGAYYEGSGTKVSWKKFLGITTESRIIGGNESAVSKEVPYEGPVYFEKYSADIAGVLGGSENVHYDRHFAYLRLKSYVSVDPVTSTMAGDGNFVDRFVKGDFWWPEGYNEDRDSSKAITDQYPNDHDWLSQNTANNVNVTSSAFIPGAGSKGQGQVIYFGTVPAYAFIQQQSDTGDAGEPESLHVYNGENIIQGRGTAYVVRSVPENEGEGTFIYRYFNKDKNSIDFASDYLVNLCKPNYYSYVYDEVGVNIREENNRATFYTYIGNDTALYYQDTNLEFTFGYCSRWRMAIGDVTYNGVNESSRSYEKYYVNSTKGGTSYKTKKVTPTSKYDINDLGEDNLYYNVWFPGEYYNLVQTASMDEVTVAVGYAVSGSSFMKESAAWGSYSNWGASKTGSNSESQNGAYYGTALGSIYNDAVMAAYVSADSGGDVYTEGLAGKGEQNVIFENVLYFKNHNFINTETESSEGSCPWYLHARESIRFTAVDLYIVSPYLEMNDSGVATVADFTAEKEYYAVYGDSNGNAYYSKVATAIVTKEESTGDTEAPAKETVTLCKGENAIPVTPITSFENDANGMCEIKVKVEGKPDPVSLSEIFSEIKTITVENDIMIITGPQKDANTVEQIVIGTRTDDASNDWTFKVVKNGNFKSVINYAKIIGGYYYLCGDKWIAAVSVDALKNIENNGKIANVSETDTSKSFKSTNKNHLLWVPTETNIYAADGRDTRG